MVRKNIALRRTASDSRALAGVTSKVALYSRQYVNHMMVSVRFASCTFEGCSELLISRAKASSFCSDYAEASMHVAYPPSPLQG